MAMKCWAGGYNCAESVLRGVCHAQSMELPDAAKRMATPFGGGVGRCEDICGALVGGVLAIGIALGRTDSSGDKLMSRSAAARLHAAFMKEYGSTCCRDLNRSDFDSPSHKPRCGRFVEGTTRFAIDVLRSP